MPGPWITGMLRPLDEQDFTIVPIRTENRGHGCLPTARAYVRRRKIVGLQPIFYYCDTGRGHDLPAFSVMSILTVPDRLRHPTRYNGGVYRTRVVRLTAERILQTGMIRQFLTPFRLLTPILLLALVSCSTNPVTGKRELSIVSPEQELQIGAQEFLPSQQSQGGVFRTDPELGAYVSAVGQRLAAVSDSDLPYEFVVLNNSTPNAWALPGGKIAINRGLLLQLRNEAELAAVLSHEIVHAAARHFARAMSRASALELGANILLDLAVEEEWRNTDLLQQGKQTALFAFNQRYSREAEIQSDEYGIRYMVRAGYDPGAAVSLQAIFVNMSRQSESSFDALFASHPPSVERYERNKQTVQQYPPGGRIGEKAYREATARIRAMAPAYSLMDRAIQYAAVGEHEKSVSTIEEAIRLVPNEARFHGTLGLLLYNQRNYEAAIEAYSMAISLDSGYYEYFLGRGLAYGNLERFASAEADLMRSQELFRTQLAADALAAIAAR